MNETTIGLIAFMRDLLDAGMDIQETIRQGFLYALDAVKPDNAPLTTTRISAALLLKKACQALEISRSYQMTWRLESEVV